MPADYKYPPDRAAGLPDGSAAPDSPQGAHTTTQLNGNSAWLDVVQERVTSLRYGIIQIVVHDGRVTQVECTEKMRFDNSREKDASRPEAGVRR